MGKKTKKQRLGQIAYDLLLKSPETRDPQEIAKESLKDYEKKVLARCDDGKKKYKDDFFIVSLLRKDPVLPNVFSNLIHHRSSCPTPTYDQTTYHYSRKDDDLFFLWTIPDRETCLTFRENVLIIAPEEHWLRDIIIDFYDGELDRLCDRLNKEKPDIILYKKQESSDERHHSIS